jgi:hypothetical protein
LNRRRKRNRPLGEKEGQIQKKKHGKKASVRGVAVSLSTA